MSSRRERRIRKLKQLSRRISLWFQTRFSRKRIVVGAGGVAEPNWIPLEQNELDLLVETDWKKHFKENSVEAVFAEHVWEHLTVDQGALAARNCFRFLRPGGYLRLAVPDGCHPDDDYIQHVRPGGTGVGAHDHKVLYTFDQLRQVLESQGFEVQPLEYFDNDGQFHVQPWDPAQGCVRRSQRFDQRNQDGQLRYTSLIVDAVKKAA